MFIHWLLFIFELLYIDVSLIWFEVATADAAIFVDARFHLKALRGSAVACGYFLRLLLRDVAADRLLAFVIITSRPASAAKDNSTSERSRFGVECSEC